MNVLDTENPADARTKCLIDNTIIGFMKIINEESTMERNEMKVYVSRIIYTMGHPKLTVIQLNLLCTLLVNLSRLTLC